MTQSRLKMVGFHLTGWLVFFGLIVAFVFTSSPADTLSAIVALPFLLFIFIYTGIFYANTFVLLPKLYLRRQYLLYFFIIFLLFVAIYFFKPFDKLVMWHHGPGKESTPPDLLSLDKKMPFPRQMNGGRAPNNLDIVSVVLFIAVWAASSVLEIFRQWRTTERRALQAESDKVAAELSMLKAQINPHFLFNTLNNIYSLAITKNEQTPDAVLKLSNILRYITDDVRNDFVPLESEIDCAANYIELQKLRLSKKGDVRFSVEGDAKEKKIAPLLFMTFIENAFKYGISNHEEFVITIEITVQQRSISLFCENKIIGEGNEEREGVGINNAKKRLEYLYPQKHLLNIYTEEDKFSVHLTITV